MDKELSKARQIIIKLVCAHVDKDEQRFKEVIESEDCEKLLGLELMEYVEAQLHPELAFVPMEQ